MKNKKIKRVSMVDMVSDSLKSAIINEDYKIGEKLPSEAELSNIYGVNRLTVRLALQKLNTLGMVETKVGEGTYVKEFTFTTYLNEVSDIYLNNSKLSEIKQLRRLIELESIKLVIRNAKDQEINEIEARLQEYIKASSIYNNSPKNEEKLLDQLFERDLDFHYEICKQSKNSLFRDVFSFLRPLIKKQLSELMLERMQDPEYIKLHSTEDTHTPLMDSIKARDWKTSKSIYLDIINLQENE